MSRPLPTDTSGRVDTRGLIDPMLMAEHVRLQRYEPGEALRGIVDWFWSVEWSLPAGTRHDQQVLNHPSANISIGTVDEQGSCPDQPRGRVYGPSTAVAVRRLTDSGWTVAAKTTTGGLGGLLTQPVTQLRDRTVPLSRVLTRDDPASLIAAVAAAPSTHERVAHLRRALERTLADQDPARVNKARVVARAAHLAETDRDVRRVAELADAVGLELRTLQRLFAEFAGLSPAWVIKRWRIIEAVDRAGPRRLDSASWAEIASGLGYADQAHLIRDFRKHVGVTPTRYLELQQR